MSIVPESIKSVVQTYYQRGQELRTINPLITYFCKLYVIQAAIATNLHQSDAAVAQFVGAELDAVEALKSQLTSSVNEDDDTDATADENRQIINNVDHKGFEYIRDFATSILDSAYTDILAQKSSKARTVPKLMAAATFLALALAVFRAEDESDELKAQVREKIKFAKWHAARIVRATKNGEDPNEYVPPEVEALRRAEEQATSAERAVDAAEQENVKSPEGAEDEDEREARELLLRMRAEMDAEAGPDATGAAAGVTDADGELVLPSASSHDPASVEKLNNNNDDSDDDGGFTLPSAASHDPAAERDAGFSLPAAASHDPDIGADFSLPSASSHDPALVKSASPPPLVPKPAVIQPKPASSPRRAPSVTASSSPTYAQGRTTHTKAEIATILSNSEIFTKSQKHAKFAISALNYEDVTTAIRELNQALELLYQVRE
jgi:vacuolar protein sorting-associated protein VTA1